MQPKIKKKKKTFLIKKKKSCCQFISNFSHKKKKKIQALYPSLYGKNSVSCSVASDSLQPHGLQPSIHGILHPGFSIHGIFRASTLERVAISFSRRSSHPGLEPGSPTVQAHSLPTESPGKCSPCTGSGANRLEWKSWGHQAVY